VQARVRSDPRGFLDEVGLPAAIDEIQKAPELFAYVRARIDRRPPRILSFGHGIHACIGRHFANLEGRLCLEMLLAHAPDYEVQEARLRRIRTEFVQGWESMPVRYRAVA